MDWVGRKIGDGQRYELLRELGAGAMGVVFLGHDARLRRDVVLKILSPILARSARVRERFANEGLIQANLLHDHIVRVIDAFDEADTCAIVMDFVDGPSLDQHLVDEGGALPFARIHAILAPVCEAVAFAHANHVVHRDLKPANILLDLSRGFEVPKVADFGIAKIAADGEGKTRAGAVIGTPSFMPPEQLRGQTDLDHRADVYALGVMLHQLATGSLPFGELSEYEITFKVLSAAPIEPPSSYVEGLPEGFDAVCAKAMAPDREQRYASVGELRSELDRMLAGTRPDAAEVPESAPASPAEPDDPADSGESADAPATEGLEVEALAAGPASLDVEYDAAAATGLKQPWLGWAAAAAAALVAVVVAGTAGGDEAPAPAVSPAGVAAPAEPLEGATAANSAAPAAPAVAAAAPVAPEAVREVAPAEPPPPSEPEPERIGRAPMAAVSAEAREEARRTNNLGFKQYKRGNNRAALAYYEAALRLDVNRALYWYNAACMYAALGDTDAALRHLTGWGARTDKILAEQLATVSKDTDFGPIRHQAAFQRWLERIKP